MVVRNWGVESEPLHVCAGDGLHQNGKSFVVFLNELCFLTRAQFNSLF